MSRQKFFWSAGIAVFFVAEFLFSYSFAQNVQILDLSSQNLRNRLYACGFITSQPVPSWGKIVGTKNQAFNLSEGEFIFIKPEPGKALRVGDRFAIGHVGKEVFLPGEKKKIGNLVSVPGEVIIVNTKEGIVTAKIEKSHSIFFVGDLILSPLSPPPSAIPIRTLKSIEGSILLSFEDSKHITEREFVFIDRGRRDGLIPGDLFSIYQTGFFTEEIRKAKEKLPKFKVGELVVVSVQEETSTALVTQSSQEIHVGDKVASGRE
jgi:hypothetical protein